ncbi:hypothetical protein AVEN_3834-1 [Araneus ventricosus]|uniref:Uncharacterized protein n=1 Tax=Araneus ventricosus TaxID=182803 RepID=A0A4Y2GQM2_ARAVE|nr:hypothetical protein AVEN_3834-1 [Araneus ventricosus]
MGRNAYLVDMQRCHGGPVRLFAGLPDLSYLGFYCWCHKKANLYETPVDSNKDLVSSISVPTEDVRDTIEIFHNHRDSIKRRFHANVRTSVQTSEHHV